MNSTRSKYIHPSAVIGYQPRHLQGSVPWELGLDDHTVSLPDAVYVGPFAAIGAGAQIGYGCVIDAYCRVEPLASIGVDSLILYRGTVGVSARVGSRCVIGGSVSENTIVEDECTSLGKLIHTHWDSFASWDGREEEEPSPVVRRRSFIGHDALIVGGIEIGPLAYVCAGAICTRSVPPYHIACGVNKVVHYSQWPGQLAANPLFQQKL